MEDERLSDWNLFSDRASLFSYRPMIQFFPRFIRNKHVVVTTKKKYYSVFIILDYSKFNDFISLYYIYMEKSIMSQIRKRKKELIN